MAGQIIPAGQFNPASLTASGAYIAIQNAPGYITGAPTDVVGLVGTASWGPVNLPVFMGSGQDAVQAFGPVGPAALTDPYDLATDLELAFDQASNQASLQAWGVRVTDGTDTAATATLAGVATAVPTSVAVGGTITSGDTAALTLTSTGIVGSPVTVTYTCSSTDTTATVAVGLANLINANAALIAASIYAGVSGSVVTVYWPTGISVTVSEATTPTTGGPTLTLASGSAATTGALATALYTGSGGNLVQVVLANGTQVNTITATVVPPYGGVAEVYLNLPSSGFWAAFKNAINNGMSSARPPSQIITLTSVNIAVGAPTLGTFLLGSGTDGRSGVVTTTLIGSDTAVPKTGMYSLRARSPAVGIVWLTGVTSISAPPALVGFGRSEACSVLWAFPFSTSTATALSTLQAIGEPDPSFNPLKDWIYFLDANNKQVRATLPCAVFGGMWATQAPQNSPDNKQVYGVLGTDHNPPNTSGATPYTLGELGQLQEAGIGVITNPINAGPMWGTWAGRSTSSDPATVPSEYWRMTCYLARSFEAYCGKYVGQLQSAQSNDPLRRKIKTELNNFLTSLQGNGQVDDFAVLCEFKTTGSSGNGYNTPASIAMHYLYALAQVRYLSSVWYFILDLQGGTTVTVTSTQQLPTA